MAPRVAGVKASPSINARTRRPEACWAAILIASLLLLAKMRTGHFLVGTLFAGLSTQALSVDPLTFDDDGTFQISIFEDLHFGESEFSTPPSCPP